MIQRLSTTHRYKLRRVIAFLNGKGGVGKTSICANTAGILAEAEYKTLVIDLDKQGNQGRDLGYKDTEYDDQGEALFNALVLNKPLVPVKGIRPNLDVIPAGVERLELVADALAGRAMRNEDVSTLLAQKIAEIADQYDVILIDCPPGDAVLQDQAIVASKWLVIPTQLDDASLDGLKAIARRVASSRTINESLQVLGVVIFAALKSATRVTAETRTKLEAIMGGSAPVFTSTIRFAQSSAVTARARGQVAIELARDAEGEDRFAWKKALDRRAKGEAVDPSDTKPSTRIADSATSLASDYLELTGEILNTLGEAERAEATRTEAGA